MEDWNRRQDLYDACLDKQYYELYLKVKDLPDSCEVKHELKNPEGEVVCTPTISVGMLKVVGEYIEERIKRKTE